MLARSLSPYVVAVAIGLYAPIFLLSINYNQDHAGEVLINDVSRLNPTHVNRIVQGHEEEGLKQALAEATKEGLKVSIAGKRHSMGGHAFYKDAVVLDMTGFNRVLGVDPQAKTITVQSGATWAQVIAAANPYNLSVAVMQAYNGFTIGGSLSVNVHESDPNFGPLIETVRSFRLLMANGTVVGVSRTQDPELFSLVIGGYGLFGIILDATLQLTDNTVLSKDEQVIDFHDYLRTFRGIRNQTAVGQVFARLSIAPNDGLLREMVVTTYSVTNMSLEPYKKLDEPSVGLKRFVFGLSRMTDWGKDLRWNLQKDHSDLVDAPIISRNNLMNGDLGFLDYTSATDTDILQEYFVPVDKLTPFLDELRAVVQDHDINMLSATIRYIPVNTESVMSYSSKESFGVVLYFNIGTSINAQSKVRAWTQELVGDAIAQGGTYYLPYMSYPTPEQLRQAYPQTDHFFERKSHYDPELRFMSTFYDDYANH